MTKTSRQLTGSAGEVLAEQFLVAKGYEILEKNYRYKRAEIDLIALWKNELLVFIEVKKRLTDQHGAPETFVSEKQQKLIQSAAECYIHAIKWMKDIRFDIISIDQNEIPFHIQDAFF